MPKNFSWVVDNRLAGLGWPGTIEEIQFLKKVGVKRLISLTESRLEILQKFPGEFVVLFCKVQDFTPPTLHQIKECIAFIEKHNDLYEPVGVHCAHGCGRTGTVLACYMVKHFKLTATASLETLRGMRPGSVETEEQENMVKMYEEYLRSTSDTSNNN
ncbi:dual specificity protein phosphatase 23-like [Mya arenaria]|nr:dual specificity protein phosphatase 23-like [Mya arenaria]